ncbi:MAG: hypothetical protein B0D82_02230, partial [Candidatus Sedimenticola endophacoides]
LEQGSLTPALADLEKAVRLRPDDASLRVNRSQVYRRFNRPQEALADINKAVELQPDLVAARFNRGVMLYTDGNYQEALADFEHCIAADPHSAGPYLNRGITRDALGDRPGAVEDLTRFLELAKNPAWKERAQQLLDAWNKPEQAGESAAKENS